MRIGPKGLIYICAPNDFAERYLFFDSIMFFVLNWEFRDFILLGYFNSLSMVKSVGGVNGYSTTSDEPINLVDALDFHDLLLQGSSFIYFGSGQSIARSRIDRFLVSNGVGDWFSNLSQTAIICILSYHILIVISSVDLQSGPRVLRFFNIWCHNKNLVELVKNSWRDLSMHPGLLWDRMNMVKSKVSRW